MAVAALHGAGLDGRVAGWLNQHYPERDAGPLLAMLDQDLRCPPTSSLGRWFDAAAGLLGLRAESRYEGQAAMELEGLAAAHGRESALPGGYAIRDSELDFSPLLPILLECDDPGRGAALFHATLAAGFAEWALVASQGRLSHRSLRLRGAVDREKEAKIAVGGGCAMNAVLMSALRRNFEARGMTLLEARQVPPNDGGLALGQAWVARRMG